MKTKERVVVNVKPLPRTKREALRAEAWTAFRNGEGASSVARRLRIRFAAVRPPAGCTLTLSDSGFKTETREGFRGGICLEHETVNAPKSGLEGTI